MFEYKIIGLTSRTVCTNIIIEELKIEKNNVDSKIRLLSTTTRQRNLDMYMYSSEKEKTNLIRLILERDSLKEESRILGAAIKNLEEKNGVKR